MTAREEVLDRVRRALGRQTGQPPAPAPPARIRVPVIPPAERVPLFTERLEAVGGKVHRVATLDAARDTVASLLAGATAVLSQSALLERARIATLPQVSGPFSDEPSLRAACATAAFGITGADFGLAETGTLVTRSGTEARLASLLPPSHIAILPLSRMLTGLDELFERVPQPADAGASMVFITGPSRSADIEMILVRGVHGPKVVHVIVVEGE